MMIMHAIREAHAEFEVYALLNVYVEAVRLDRETGNLSAPPVSGPITGMDDLMRQIKLLIGALETASRRLDDHCRTIVKEVLYVFCMAADHLDALHRLAAPILPVHPKAMRVATSSVAAGSSESRGDRSDNVQYPGGMAKLQREGARGF
jgi:hypothetical protein